MINTEYIQNYLIFNRIIFFTNVHNNNMTDFQNYTPFDLQMKNNFVGQWRKIFIENNIFEIETPCHIHRKNVINK